MKQMVATEKIEDIRSDEEVKEIINKEIFKNGYDYIRFNFEQSDFHYSIFYIFPLNIIQKMLKDTNSYLISQGIITQPFTKFTLLVRFFTQLPLERKRLLSAQSCYLYAAPLIYGSIGNVKCEKYEGENLNVIEGGFMNYFNEMDGAITFGGSINVSSYGLSFANETTDIKISATTDVYNLDIRP